jgi:L-alanine-DL-glutamate epimerase-like enolase superfamily enzyme
MKITGLRTQLVEFPYTRPMGLNPGFELRTGGCVLVFLESDQGEVGEGLAYTFNARRLKIIDEVVQSLAPLLIGLDPRQSGAFLTRAAADVRAIGTSGLATIAISAIDQALLDLRAKLAQTSVAGLLGAYRTAMPVYNSADYWITRSLDDLQLAAADHKKRGFRAIKLRLTGKVAEDVARVKAVREVLGPDFSVLGDLNQRSTVSDAIRLGHALEEFNLTWLEEPVPCHDHAGEAAVAAARQRRIDLWQPRHSRDAAAARVRCRHAGPSAHGRADGVHARGHIRRCLRHARIQPLLHGDEPAAARGDPQFHHSRVYALA